MNIIENNKKVVLKDFKNALIKYCKNNHISLENDTFIIIQNPDDEFKYLSLDILVELMYNGINNAIRSSKKEFINSSVVLKGFQIHDVSYKNKDKFVLEFKFYWDDIHRFQFITQINEKRYTE